MRDIFSATGIEAALDAARSAMPGCRAALVIDLDSGLAVSLLPADSLALETSENLSVAVTNTFEGAPMQEIGRGFGMPSPDGADQPGPIRHALFLTEADSCIALRLPRRPSLVAAFLCDAATTPNALLAAAGDAVAAHFGGDAP